MITEIFAVIVSLGIPSWMLRVTTAELNNANRKRADSF